MSVTTPNTTDTTNDTPAKQPARASARRTSTRNASMNFTKDASLSQVVNAVAQRRKIDATKAGKLVRSHIRGNFDHYAKGTNGTPRWGALAKAKENKDGNRYPLMSPSVANHIVKRMTPSAS